MLFCTGWMSHPAWIHNWENWWVSYDPLSKYQLCHDGLRWLFILPRSLVRTTRMQIRVTASTTPRRGLYWAKAELFFDRHLGIGPLVPMLKFNGRQTGFAYGLEVEAAKVLRRHRCTSMPVWISLEYRERE